MAASFGTARFGFSTFLQNLNGITAGRRLCLISPVKNAAAYSSQPSSTAARPESVGNASAEKVEKISKAMKAYLERANAHNAFMVEEIAEFEIGKRHLANIMGADPDMFTQDDIDKAIEYLLPSGLFDKKARPKLKHPEEILPKRKAAEFGVDGRPFDCMFYTGKPKFNTILHELAIKLEELKKYEDIQLAKGKKPEAADSIKLAGAQWIEKNVFESRYQEKISDNEYKSFVALIEMVSKQPYSIREKDYVGNFQVNIQVQSSSIEIPPLQIDEKGRAFQDAEGKRKKAIAKVRVYDRGTGLIRVNDKEFIEMFPRLADREQIIFPLHLTEKLNAVDITATAEGGGPSGQAGAIRFALAKALRSFVDLDMVEKMRLAGLLTWDPRTIERMKPGQQGARRKYTWKKR